MSKRSLEQVEHEVAITQDYKDRAARVIDEHGLQYGWDQEDIKMVKHMLGLHLPAGLHPTKLVEFNGKPG